MKFIDHFLNHTTTYRLVLEYLFLLLMVAVIFSWLGWLAFGPLVLLASVVFLLMMSWAANTLLATIFKVPANVESAYITALILALIITPRWSIDNFLLLGWAALLAMASKYFLNIGGKHIFNPAAVAVAITALVLQQAASWWVGTGRLLPLVVVGGWLIVKKTRRSALVASFLTTALVVIVGYSWLKGTGGLSILPRVLMNTPLLFFAAVMITEPLTMPPTKRWQIVYGLVVGCLFLPQNHLGRIYSTPELALIIGNLMTYVISPKIKLNLKLKTKIKQTPDIYDFVFTPNRPVIFKPGQYLEWTLDQAKSDRRGNRRYFTIASSPTEADLIMGVKFYEAPSSFKRQLLAMNRQTKIIATQLAGDFTLPADSKQKLVFIAGGIGVTPFRSMIKFLLDTKERRDIIMFYSGRQASDFAYKDIFDQAVKQLGLKIIYTISDAQKPPAGWSGRVGALDRATICREAPDYLERIFYLSGPPAMVKAFKEVLIAVGVSRRKIKTDFFPGLV